MLASFIHYPFRATNKLKKHEQTNHLGNPRLRISVKKVVRPNHCSNRPKTMSQVVKMWSLIVIAYQIQVHKHFWLMIWPIDIASHQRVVLNVVVRVDQSVGIVVG